MQIDLGQTYTNADDSPAIDAVTQKPIDLRHMLIQALLSDAASSGGPIPNDQKMKRYDLYRTIKKAPRYAELQVEQLAILKDAVLIFPTLVVGQSHTMLETAWVPPPVEAVRS